MGKIVLSLILILNHTFAEAKPSVNPQGLTIDEIKRQYPNAEIRIVSVEEISEYKKLYAQNSTSLSPQSGAVVTPPAAPLKPFNPCEYARGSNEKTSENDWRGAANPDGWNFNTYSSGSSGSSGKDFLIFVAIVGVVVVAALVVYSIGYLMTMAKYGYQCRAWSDFGVRFSFIEDNSSTQMRHGNFTGAYYSLGYVVPAGIMGLTAEVGGHNFKMFVKDINQDRTFNGAYLLIGPSFSIPLGLLGGHAFQIELLAGTSTESGIGLMSTLRFGFEFKMSNQYSLGLNLGAALINIKDFDNYIKDDDQLNFLTGVATSYRF